MVSEEQESEMELASEKIPVPPAENAVEKSGTVEESKPEVPRKKHRKRYKELYAAILKQMEFYFGDANLSKDRFLAKLISEDPWVDLKVFIDFNKMKILTTDVSRIAQALKESKMLEVSEDGTKVRRTTSIEKKQNSEECTVYIQRLAPEADHDWISKIFSQYGPIDYISIPKYKNKAIKGFAFVEYNKPEDAQKCLMAFRAKGCELPSQTSPNSLLSITTHEDCDRQIGKELILKKETEEKVEVENSEMDSKKDSQNVKKRKKKRLSNDESANEKERRSKKRKGNSESLNTSDGNEEHDSASDCDKKRKRENLSEDESTKKRKISETTAGANEAESSKTVITEREEKNSEPMEQTEPSDETKLQKKKKRKRNRSARKEDLEAPDTGLEIMAKREWKRLRNKYLEMQRAKMKQLKQHLKRATWNQWHNVEKINVEKEESSEKNVVKEELREKNVVKEGKSPRFTFTPGVIVKIEMESPCSDPKNFKMELKGSSSNSSVKYVDVSEGSNIAFVRCDSAESAKSLAQKATEERTMIILDGEEEKSYWAKMAQDREEKIGNNVRVKQRGRDKLLKRAEKELGKHIKFDQV